MKGSLPIYVILPLEHILKFFLNCWKYFYLLKVRVRLEHKIRGSDGLNRGVGLCCALVVRVWFEFEVRFVLRGIVSNSIISLIKLTVFLVTQYSFNFCYQLGGDNI